MLVKLKRNWFAPNGQRFKTRDGLAEIGDDLRDSLPTDAVIMSESGSLPTKGAPPLPGFGAKPLFEQVLDQIPHAAPTHQITLAAGEVPDDGLHSGKEPTPPQGSKSAEVLAEERYKEEKKAYDEDVKDSKKALKEVQNDVDEGLAKAKGMEDNIAEAKGDTANKSKIKI